MPDEAGMTRAEAAEHIASMIGNVDLAEAIARDPVVRAAAYRIAARTIDPSHPAEKLSLLDLARRLLDEEQP